MPPFETILKEDQLNDLLAYLSQIDRSGKPTLPALGPDGKPLPAQPEGTPAPGGAGQPTATPAQ
jgi:hypothetical protein